MLSAASRSSDRRNFNVDDSRSRSRLFGVGRSAAENGGRRLFWFATQSRARRARAAENACRTPLQTRPALADPCSGRSRARPGGQPALHNAPRPCPPRTEAAELNRTAQRKRVKLSVGQNERASHFPCLPLPAAEQIRLGSTRSVPGSYLATDRSLDVLYLFSIAR
jgi:hypothetical protein